MNTVDIITKKRNGHVLSDEEIQYIVTGYTDGSIPDYQMSAFLMAVYFQGMNHDETVKLTQIMRDSGDIVLNDPPELVHHSTKVPIFISLGY